MSGEQDYDIAIVGLGPVGAIMAGLLGQRGHRVVVVERSLDVFPLPRAAHIDHTGLRTLQELGLLEEMLKQMVPNRSLDLVTADHDVLVRVPADQGSVSGLPASMYFYQPTFDAALEEAVQSLPGVTVRRGVEMISFEGDEEGVTLLTRDLDGAEGQLRADWMVGCDGAWSTVREGLEIPLESLDFDERWLVLDLHLHEGHPPLPDNAVEVCDPARPHVTTPIPGNRQRFELMLLEDEDTEEMQRPEVVAGLLSSWLPPDTYVMERAAVYTFHGLVAERWREGRVLLAGDAGHQMPPFLGQGMCSGIRDASNLAWKLDLVLGGTAPASLLDTYELERKPHVRKVIEKAVAFGRVICMLDEEAAAARDHDLLTGSPDERLTFALPSLPPGPLVLDGGGGIFPQPLVDGQRLDDGVGPRFLVIGRSQELLGPPAEWWRESLDAFVATLDELDDQKGTLDRWLTRRGADVVIVRPDRIVLSCGSDLGELTERARAAFGDVPDATGANP